MSKNSLRIRSWGGIGDALLLTPSLRAFKEAHPGGKLAIYMVCDAHESVFRHNPHVDRLYRGSTVLNSVTSILSQRKMIHFDRVDYGRYGPSLWGGGPAADLIAHMLGLTLQTRRVELFLTRDEESEAIRLLGPFPKPVAIHAASAGSRNKQWPMANWESLAARNRDYSFIQLGSSDEPPAAGAVDLRGKTSLRISFAVLKYALAFIGVDSSLAHAASAFGTPTVALFGPSTPQIWGHQGNANLYHRVRCSPCIDLLQAAPCPYEKQCMSAISVAEVEAALERQIASRRESTDAT